MREKRFVEQNQKNWARFEKASETKSQVNPEEFSDLFSQITEDLSYSRTHYPKRSIRVYLNGLAQSIYLKLHRQRGDKSKKFTWFWINDLPLALYQAKRELNVSLLFFLASMTIGVLSAVHDPDFAQVILGSEYVEMTEENIANGDPMGVYKSSEEFGMFFQITINNIMVAFRTFVLGAFFGVGTLIIMLYNGIMVGTFQYFFVERELLQESFLTIWMHGALEISSIVIAGAAGLTMGRGLLFPGTLPRRQSFIIGARRGIKIMVGLVPFFITAGFIEGFFTRLTEMPDILRGSFIFMCFAFVAAYFWWYPSLRFRGTPGHSLDEEELVPESQELPELYGLRKTREIFTTTFMVYRKTFFSILGVAAGFSLIYAFVFYLLEGSEGLDMVAISEFDPFSVYQFHDYSIFPSSFFLNCAFIAATAIVSLALFKKAYPFTPIKINGSLLLKILVLVSLFELSILTDQILVEALGIIAIPFLTFWLVVSVTEKLSLPNAFSSMLALLNGTKRHVFISFLAIALLSMLILVLLASPFTWFYVEVLQWNIDADYQIKENVAVLSLIFIDHFGLALVLPLTLYSQLLEYYSAQEAKNAIGLSERVQAIGIKRRAYGMEQE
ncbi:stage II sporulation protein M [Cryomorphaceae bacterium 1068]|nr:stage II sporulation protein M [Cryomorphaceae bacterium 1068]